MSTGSAAANQHCRAVAA